MGGFQSEVQRLLSAKKSGGFCLVRLQKGLCPFRSCYTIVSEWIVPSRALSRQLAGETLDGTTHSAVVSKSIQAVALLV
jgi:hypothetical protein